MSNPIGQSRPDQSQIHPEKFRYRGSVDSGLPVTVRASGTDAGGGSLTGSHVSAGGRQTRRITLAQIAASAGVSVATLSKVVNGRQDVAADTRVFVEELLREHSYVPPSARRSVGTGATVELIVHGGFGAYATQVIEGVVHAGAEMGASIVIGHVDDDQL